MTRKVAVPCAILETQLSGLLFGDLPFQLP